MSPGTCCGDLAKKSITKHTKPSGGGKHVGVVSHPKPAAPRSHGLHIYIMHKVDREHIASEDNGKVLCPGTKHRRKGILKKRFCLQRGNFIQFTPGRYVGHTADSITTVLNSGCSVYTYWYRREVDTFLSMLKPSWSRNQKHGCIQGNKYLYCLPREQYHAIMISTIAITIDMGLKQINTPDVIFVIAHAKPF